MVTKTTSKASMGYKLSNHAPLIMFVTDMWLLRPEVFGIVYMQYYSSSMCILIMYFWGVGQKIILILLSYHICNNI